MGFIQKLTNQRFARSAATFMNYVCWLLIAFLALDTILCFLGRQTFSLHTDGEIYESAICAEDDHTPHSRNMIVDMRDNIHVFADENERLGLPLQIGLAFLFAIYAIPGMLSFWFLARVFSNVREDRIFTGQNAACLLYYGLLQIFIAVFVPFLKLMACPIISFVSGNRVEISTGQDMLNTLIPAIAFLVAAYIINYGVNLQDEVDHTL